MIDSSGCYSISISPSNHQTRSLLSFVDFIYLPWFTCIANNSRLLYFYFLMSFQSHAIVVLLRFRWFAGTSESALPKIRNLHQYCPGLHFSSFSYSISSSTRFRLCFPILLKASRQNTKICNLRTFVDCI